MTATAPRLQDLTTATPVQIDTALETLYLQELRDRQAVAVAIVSLHHCIGEDKRHTSRNRFTWPTSTAEAVAALRAHMVEDTRSVYAQMAYRDLGATLARYERAVAALQANLDAQAPLHAEYTRRGGWARYFTCLANGGHVHSSMRCSTCNRGEALTEFGWTPTLSGLTEDEAIELLGKYASSLCTVCFPHAPTERTDGHLKAAADYCPGSGKAPVQDGRTHSNWQGYRATCTGCGELNLITMVGAVRKHKTPKPTQKGS